MSNDPSREPESALPGDGQADGEAAAGSDLADEAATVDNVALEAGGAAHANGSAAADDNEQHDDEKLPLLRSLRNRITPDPELDQDNRYEFTKQELADRLATDDPEKAEEILTEAREISKRMVEGRAEGVERRAATLQSATAIAGSFSIAGAGLLITDVHDQVWQAVIGALLLWITGNLGLCGWRATQAASSVIHGWAAPQSQAILSRTDQTLAELRIDRSVQILRSAGWNARYARFKVTMLRRASRHLVRATLGIPVLVIAVLAYALTYSPAHTSSRSVANASAARLPPHSVVKPKTSPGQTHTVQR